MDEQAKKSDLEQNTWIIVKGLTEKVEVLEKRVALMESVVYKLMNHSHDSLGRPCMLLEKI